MIRFEDEELVNMVLSGESCIAVPFEIYVPTEGEPVITVYPFLEDVACDFEKKFEGELLSANALKWLDDAISATVKEMNYVHAEDSSHLLREYKADDCREYCERLMLGKDIITPVDALPKDLDLSYFEDYNVSESISAVCLSDDKVISVATTNDIAFEDKSVEICVETLPEYEGKGYGTAAVAALCSYYNEKGIKVKYECAKANTASVKIAEKCGFEFVCERYSYVCYAIEEEE